MKVRRILKLLSKVSVEQTDAQAKPSPAKNDLEEMEQGQELGPHPEQEQEVAGWRLPLCWLVGPALASSPTLPLFLMVRLR